MTLTPQWLDELRARVTLSALIGKTVKVTRAGREYKACCPFHNEKTPSFTINDEKGFYHCFGCGAHGDAIRWMTEQRGLSFMDAIKELAAGAGMDVPAADPRAAEKAERQSTLRDVMTSSQEWFVQQLGSIDGAHARDYLTKRGITEKTARTFGLGFAPDARGKLKAALDKKHPVPQLIESGMLIAVEDKEPYDRFRGRLMIPIKDARGRVIAFGGRILGDGEPKYLNSPDTPLFDKGRTLYNLDIASPASRKSGRIIVVEGYMDVIALAQAGFDDAVAPLGTALTEQQIEMLWRMVPAPILCFDGDAAGHKAAMRAANRALPLLKPGYSVTFVSLPSGQDPDDIVSKQGAAAFETLLTGAQPLVERLWQDALVAAPINTPEERAAFKQRLADIVTAIADRDIAALYREEYRERYDAMFFGRKNPAFQPRRGEFTPRAPATPGRGRWQAQPRILPPTDDTRRIKGNGLAAPIMAAIIGGLLRYPVKLSEHAEQLATLRPADSELAILLSEMLDAAMLKERLDTAGLLTILEPSIVYNKALMLLRADRMPFSFTHNLDGLDDAGHRMARAQSDLDEAIGTAIAWPEIETALDDATRRMASSMDEESFAEQQRLLKVKRELTQRLGDLMQAGE